MVQECALPPRAAANKRKLDITMYGYALAATRVREIIWLGKAASRAGNCWPEASKRQWHGPTGSCHRPSKLLHSIMAENAGYEQCVKFMGETTRLL